MAGRCEGRLSVGRFRVLAIVALVAGGMLASTGLAGANGPACERGEFCSWSREEYRGALDRISLGGVSPGECAALPDGFDARSFANRMSREVTVYEDRQCSTEGEFDTYPGAGTYVPEAPYVVRGVQVW
jgi:hypothetical protein